MNNRIKQLALEAGEYVNSVYTPPVRSKTPGKIWEDGHIDWMEQFRAKFAELIIQECLDQLLVSDPTEDFDKGIAWSAKQIKQHFGVEE